MVTIKSFDEGEFDAYLAVPAGGYGPGILVLQEIFGVNEYMRQVADWYAAHGSSRWFLIFSGGRSREFS